MPPEQTALIGKQLASFRITARLGAGGMGEVFRAEDSRLGREVAVKVLPAHFVADPDRLARFEREARVLASLNHPSIASVYEVGRARPQERPGGGEGATTPAAREDAAGDGELHFLVMELAPGEPLSERIAHGALPLEGALPIARQIAEGLEAAHERGIVHRDLKPGNVVVDDEGKVKILDFGLAKALEPAADAGPPSDLTRSPTATFQATRAGVLLGTAPYMSPEQARGEPVDRRTDIWAFGCVLYEMLSGQCAFAADTVSDTLAAVLARDPDLSRLPRDLPSALCRLLDRCLVKDRRERLRDIGDARLELDEAAAVGQGMEPVSAPPRRLLPLVLTAAAALAVGTGVGWLARTPPPPDSGSSAPLVRSSLNLPEGTHLAGWASPVVAISPDGGKVAFVTESDAGRRLYLRHLDRFEATAVPDTDTAEGPFFSPDGQWLGWAQGRISAWGTEPGRLMRVSVDGGLPQKMADISDFFGADWSEDGIVYFVDQIGEGLWRVPGAGGARELVSPVEEAKGAVLWPEVLPGGRFVLVTDVSKRPYRILAVETATGAVREVGLAAGSVHFAGSGHLVFMRSEDAVLAAEPFDPERLKLTGPPVGLVKNIARDTDAGVGVFALSAEGTLVYGQGYLRGSGYELSRLVRIGRNGEIRPLPFEPSVFGRGLTVSPDGRFLAVSSLKGPAGGLWIYDLERQGRSRLPGGGLNSVAVPAWSRDGRWLAFTAMEPDSSGLNLYRQAADGSGEPERLVAAKGEAYSGSWAPDGTLLFGLYRVDDPRHYPLDILALAPGSAEPEPLVATEAGEAYPRLSSDGKWLAFEATREDGTEVYLRARSGGAWIPVSIGGGHRPVWSADGRRLVYLGGSDLEDVYAVDVNFDPTPRVGRPKLLFTVPGLRNRSFVVDPVGDGYFALQEVAGSGLQTELRMVTGWFGELQRLAPPGS